MFHGTFLDPTGEFPALKGETALLNEKEGGMCVAQFDNIAFEQAYGWWSFPISSFDVDKKEDWNLS